MLQPGQFADLVSAIRMTAGALRQEADYIEPKNKGEARLLRLRARALDARAAEMEGGPQTHAI